MPKPKTTFDVTSRRLDEHGSFSRCKQAEISLDTDLAGNPEAFTPAELLLAALSACMIKGIERVMPILRFSLKGVESHIHGVRQDVPAASEKDALGHYRRVWDEIRKFVKLQLGELIPLSGNGQ